MGNSPGDFEAVHSLAASGENTLKGQNRHFVQGCTETVEKHTGRKTEKEAMKTLEVHQASQADGEFGSGWEIWIYQEHKKS